MKIKNCRRGHFNYRLSCPDCFCQLRKAVERCEKYHRRAETDAAAFVKKWGGGTRPAIVVLASGQIEEPDMLADLTAMLAQREHDLAAELLARKK